MTIDLSKFFHKLCQKFAILLIFLLVELIILIWRLTKDTRPITTRQYIKFIEEKNPTIRYTKKMKSHSHGECSVCLCEFEEGDKIRHLKCKHTFHKDCLDKWLKDYVATCPLCRNQVLPEHVVSELHRQQQNQQGSFEGNDENLPYVLFLLRGGSISNTSRLQS
jgi:E3 ubiquitin-protein ligase RHA2